MYKYVQNNINIIIMRCNPIPNQIPFIIMPYGTETIPAPKMQDVMATEASIKVNFLIDSTSFFTLSSILVSSRF